LLTSRPTNTSGSYGITFTTCLVGTRQEHILDPRETPHFLILETIGRNVSSISQLSLLRSQHKLYLCGG